MDRKISLSPKRMKELQEQLDHKKSVERLEVAARLKEAISHGDLSENSEYDAARDAQAMLEAEIADLEVMLAGAEVLDVDSISTEFVSVGCRVKVYFTDDDEEEEYDIVSSGEADAMENKLSNDSPLGKALEGAKVGENVTAKTPGGDLKMKVLSIERIDF